MAKKKMDLDTIALVLVLIGGLNWGLIAINSNWDVVNMLLGSMPTIARIVYGLVGLSAVLIAYKKYVK